MSDDNSHSSDTISNKKGFFSLLLGQLFHGEPKNRDELLALIRDSGQNDLIDEDTRDMLEGVMDIADVYKRQPLPCTTAKKMHI